MLAGHGTPMRRLIDSGAVSGRNFVQVGLRGYWPPPEIFAWMQAQGMRWHLMREIEERGAEAVIDDAIAEALDGPDLIYLSVDIDVIDPGMAPGTGTPEPGGMLTRELLRAVRRIVGRVELAGMDVVEVSPPYDHAEVTSMAAHRAVLEAISALAVKKRDGRGVPPARPIAAATPVGQAASERRPAGAPAGHDARRGQAARRGGGGGPSRRDPGPLPCASTPIPSRPSRKCTRRRGSRMSCAPRLHRGGSRRPPRRRRSGPRWPGASAPTGRASASWPSTTPCPGWATAAGTTRWPPAGSARRSPWPRWRRGLRGQIVFLGTPAEEAGSGKQYMLDDGLFEGLDAALLFHPGDRDHAACALLACEDVEVTFTGLQAHAASDPWRGRNALDAMVLLFTSIGLWRQQLRPDARVHGIITDGGTAANIIPDRSVGHFMIRSTDQAYFESMRQRFREMVTAAALATGTEAATVFSSGSTVMKDNATLAARFRANMQAAGRADQGVDPERLGSSDMGNVSLVLPTIHPTLAICDDGVPGHSTLFRDAAATPRADETTLLAATLVAQTAYELFTEPGLVEAAWREFRGT